MSKRDEKWVMFRNYMHNELGITKEEIRVWIREAIEEQARLIVEHAFCDTNPRTYIEKAIYDNSYFRGKNDFCAEVKKLAASILAEQLEIKMKE